MGWFFYWVGDDHCPNDQWCNDLQCKQHQTTMGSVILKMFKSDQYSFQSLFWRMLCPYSLSRSLKFEASRTQQNKSATYVVWIGLAKKNDVCLRPIPPLRESSCRAVQHPQPVRRLWNTSDWTKKQRHHDQPTEATTRNMKDSPLKTPGRCSFRITLSSTFFAPRGFKLSKGSPHQHCLVTEGKITRNMTAQLTCSTVQGLVPPSHIPWLGWGKNSFYSSTNWTFQEPLLGGSCTVPSSKIHRGVTRTCSSFESY